MKPFLFFWIMTPWQHTRMSLPHIPLQSACLYVCKGMCGKDFFSYQETITHGSRSKKKNSKSGQSRQLSTIGHKPFLGQSSNVHYRQEKEVWLNQESYLGR